MAGVAGTALVLALIAGGWRGAAALGGPPASESAGATSPVAASSEKAAGESGAPAAIAGSLTQHWSIMLALAGGEETSAQDGLHRLIEASRGEQNARVRSVLDQLVVGDLHAATHAFEKLLAGYRDPSLSLEQLRLRVALVLLGDASQPESTSPTLAHALEHAGYEGTAANTAHTAQLREDLSSDLRRAIDADALSQPCVSPHGHGAGVSAVSLVVLADASWRQLHGADSAAAAHARVEAVADLFAPGGTPIRLESVVAWEQNEDQTITEAALDAADFARVGANTITDAGASLTLVLTAREFPSGADGYYRQDRGVIVARESRGAPGMQTLVLAHEIGHRLGLEHRQGTLMQARGFPPAAGFSDCQIDAMRGSQVATLVPRN